MVDVLWMNFDRLFLLKRTYLKRKYIRVNDLQILILPVLVIVFSDILRHLIQDSFVYHE